METINKIMTGIDNGAESDVEAPSFEAEFEWYMRKVKRNPEDTDGLEKLQCKVS